MHKLMTFAAFVVGAVVPGTMALAQPTLNTVTLVGTDYEYSYSFTLGGDEGFLTGSRFVIFDFGNYVSGSVSPGIYAADLAASTELTTLGMLLAPGATDDPLITNLVFTWIGSPFNASGGPFSEVDLAGLTARSTNSTVALGSFSALTTNNNGFAMGTPITSQGFVGVPAQSPVISAPEPATWATMLLRIWCDWLCASPSSRRNVAESVSSALTSAFHPKLTLAPARAL